MLREMTLEHRKTKGVDQQPNLRGFAKDLDLIQKHFTPVEATDLIWHAKMANEVAGRTINVSFPNSIHPNIQLFNVVRDLGQIAKGYVAPTDELVPRVITKLAFPNVHINAPDHVDKPAFNQKANEIIETSKRYYYLRALQATQEKTGGVMFDGMGTQLEMTPAEIDSLISSTQEAIQSKFIALASISSGLTPVRVIDNDTFNQEALQQMQQLPQLQKVEGTRLRMNVFKFANSGLDDVRSAIVTRHQKIRRIKTGAAATITSAAAIFCGISNLRPPEIAPIPSETKESTETPPSAMTETPSYPTVVNYSENQVIMALNQCAENCPGATIENTLGVKFGDREAIFWPSESGGYFGQLLVDGKWEPLLGGVLDNGDVVWILNSDGVTPVAPGLGLPEKSTDIFRMPNPSSIAAGDPYIITVRGIDGIQRFYTVSKDSEFFEVVNAKIASLIPPESPEPVLSAEIQELQKSLEGTNYSFAWNNDLKSIALTYTDPETQKTSTIPEIVFDEKGNWKRTYTFETPYGTQAEVTIDSRVDKMTVTETPEGKKVLDFSAWCLIDGKWTRENIKGETSYNVAEAQFVLQDLGSDDPKNKGGDISVIQKYRTAVFPNAVGRWFEGTVKYNGVFFEIKNTTANTGWWGDSIKTLDDKNAKIEIETTNYVVINFTDKNSIMIFVDKEGKYQTVLINSDLNDWGNWSPQF